MKNWIKNNLIQIIVILILVFVIFLQKCGVKHTDNVINQSEMSTALLKQKNALETAFAQERIDSSKIIQNLHKRISDGLKPIIIVKEKKAQALVIQVKKDTATTALCDSAINMQEQLILDLDTKSWHDSIQLSECNKQNVYKDSIILKKDTVISETARINDKLTNELKAKNNWFNIIKIWIDGVAAGVVGTLLVVK
jgi:hypothetical protein